MINSLDIIKTLCFFNVCELHICDIKGIYPSINKLTMLIEGTLQLNVQKAVW